MQDGLKEVAGLIHYWLEDSNTSNQNLWAIVDSREEGTDLARLLFKMRFGDFTTTEIPFDNIPTYAANGFTGNRAFILADNEEIEEAQASHYDTVLVTMQDEEARGELVERDTDEKEQDFIKSIVSGTMSEEEIRRLSPESLTYLNTTARVENFQDKVRAPDLILVHQKYPNWDRILKYAGGHTQTLTSSKCLVPVPVKEETK